MSNLYTYQTPIEKHIQKLKPPFELFVDTQRIAGIALIICVFAALLFANLPATSAYYSKAINLVFGLHIENRFFSLTLQELVNDFLLVFFFFILGLEIKREFIVGELKNVKNATIVVMAAGGGVILPVTLFFLFNCLSPEFDDGWAIPIATDTAIVIGLMSFFKQKLPLGVFTFVAALSVLDDIVSIAVIALFYTDGIQMTALYYAGATAGIMLIANLSGVRSTSFYLLFILMLWIFFEMSGVHSAIAGIIAAMMIPARPKDTPAMFVKKMKKLLRKFESKHDHSQHILESDEQHTLLEQVTQASLQATVPLKRWEEHLEKPVFLIILPLFALTNGAITINTEVIHSALSSTLFWGVFVGLLLGKPLGISLLTLLALKKNIGKLPENMRYKDVIPVGIFCGIGYTMAIFVADLAFTDTATINMAKLSILLASIASAIAAFIYLLLYHVSPQKTDSQDKEKSY